MFFEWLKNKQKERFYPITHASGVLYGENCDSTVGNELKQLKSNITNTYLSKTDASNTYLSKTEASDNYLSKNDTISYELNEMELGFYHFDENASTLQRFYPYKKTTMQLRVGGFVHVKVYCEWNDIEHLPINLIGTLWNEPNSLYEFAPSCVSSLNGTICFIDNEPYFKLSKETADNVIDFEFSYFDNTLLTY